MLVRVMRADTEGVTVKFDEVKTVTIGRDLDCTICLDSPTASRHHAHLEYDGDVLVVKDNDSMNGIMVNRKKCKESELEVGDLLEVGGCVFMVESDVDDTVAPGESFSPSAATMEPKDGKLRLRVMLDAREDDSLIFSDPCSVSVGRDPESVVVLSAASASRHHARLDWDGEHLSVEDLESMNGIFVNGSRTQSMSLQPSDMIVVGGSILSVYDLDDERIFSDVEDLDEEALEEADNDPLHGNEDPTISVRKGSKEGKIFNPEAATVEDDGPEDDSEDDSANDALEPKVD